MSAPRVKRKLLWGGRFKEAPSTLLRSLNDSFAVDHLLLDVDIQGSIAWAGALREAGVISETEAARIVRGLGEIRRACAAKPPALAGHEDVHSFVEAALARKVGPLAGKLRTGRSRNDQVVTDLRLYLRRAIAETAEGALDLAASLADRAAAESATPMPGYTHMKQAEPITFGHWCLAYVEMLLRDAGRFREILRRGDECPLGSAALSGTPLPIDRARLARSLGFARPSANSLDAVSSRDTAAEFLFASSLLLVHLSRLAEDLIIYGSDEFGYVELPDALATGSSRMPHKKNPDLLELARGHAARAIGDLAGFLALLKGLPLAYNKDLQLDKEPIFRVASVLRVLLPAISAAITGLKLDRPRMREAAAGDPLLATQVADAISIRGVPFAEAHERVGRRIVEAAKKGQTLAGYGAGGGITRTDLQALNLDRALASRRAAGGTSPARVKAAARAAHRRITRLRRGP